ncbi:hypothetical protein LZ198_15160 [Myxococcus sp. K15C18031901]|uniref:hypothetical protein n=1 Tax=Myxococcus dinghuensis TaxID=2906761 RepID=UPI0020A7B795|nr:hypothetical protein [Myxococcus dinghuensis]MCP3100210.1 hypothetical protein [Myxococcus dinghuensis]
MRNMIRTLVLMSLSVGVLSACGPSAEPEATPPAAESTQVEQGIGVTPNCPIDGYLDEMVEWGSTCAACREVGGDGSWVNGSYGRAGTLYKRCCTGSSCDSWHLIRPVCTSC